VRMKTFAVGKTNSTCSRSEVICASRHASGLRPPPAQSERSRRRRRGFPTFQGCRRRRNADPACERRPDFAPIHARAETVAENEWFSDAYRRRRCIVPMNSFFQKNVSGTVAISRRDGGPFGVAGIWENWRDPWTGAWERTFAVITVPANELVATIHDRMPAILPNEQFSRWLSDEADPRDLLVPFAADQLAVLPRR
jgi:putative SOS response-associated peptidase YedK